MHDDKPPTNDGIAIGAGSGTAGGLSTGRLRRTAPLAALTARTAGEAVVVGLRSKLTGADSTEFHVRTAERYTELLGRSKGALMKAGQMLSFASMSPGIPAEFQNIYQGALTRLRDEAPPMAPELARAVLENELGRPTESAFAEFDFEPIAAASIGQVHTARLHDGRAVAVKIQYPGVADAIDSDLKNNELLSTFLGLIFGLSPRKISFDVRGAAREMSVRITEELDYRLEAANQAEFAEIYRGHPFIHVPEVIPERSTGRVLTQELVEGKSWSEALTSKQELRDQWAEAIWRFVYGSQERFYLLNADPHPGNYVFHDDGSVSFLDFGCVKRFRREQVEMMNAIARACFEGDVPGTWRASVEGGYFRSSDPVTEEEVFAYWHEPWEMFWAEQPFTVTPEYVTEWIERRFSPTGPSANAFRHITASPDYTIMSRIEMGAASIVAALRASNYWRAMAAEYLEGAPPLTATGKLDHAFFAERQAASEHA
jgi:predicted unusual protein kinase regulating ubiquinone biosynthesis (AarF/ABC1/UbiB family)